MIIPLFIAILLGLVSPALQYTKKPNTMVQLNSTTGDPDDPDGDGEGGETGGGNTGGEGEGGNTGGSDGIGNGEGGGHNGDNGQIRPPRP